MICKTTVRRAARHTQARIVNQPLRKSKKGGGLMRRTRFVAKQKYDRCFVKGTRKAAKCRISSCLSLNFFFYYQD
jgi:hypothetical protein